MRITFLSISYIQHLGAGVGIVSICFNHQGFIQVLQDTKTQLSQLVHPQKEINRAEKDLGVENQVIFFWGGEVNSIILWDPMGFLYCWTCSHDLHLFAAVVHRFSAPIKRCRFLCNLWSGRMAIFGAQKDDSQKVFKRKKHMFFMKLASF